MSFKKAAHNGSIDAQYNLGSLFLSGSSIKLPKSESEEIIDFSFSKAYDHFKAAAEKGHTLAAYNIGIMHFTGLGTY
jgi:TPR repeat protein